MITQIQSFTDVITNSSSTVFVMHEFHADYYKNDEDHSPYIEVEPITMEWLRLHPDEVEMVCSLLHVNPEEVTTLHKADWGSYYNDPDPEAWEAFLKLLMVILNAELTQLTVVFNVVWEAVTCLDCMGL